MKLLNRVYHGKSGKRKRLTSEALSSRFFHISYIVSRRRPLVYRFLTGDTDGAKADLEESVQLVPSLTQSWVKIASVYMEQSDVAKTFEAFDKAIKHNASDPDIYYHRGQGMLQGVRANCPVLIPLFSLFHNERV